MRNACNTFIGLSYPFKGRLSWAAQTRYEIEHIFALLLGRPEEQVFLFWHTRWRCSFLNLQVENLIFNITFSYFFLRLNVNYLTKLLNVLNLSWTLMSKFIPHTFVEKFFSDPWQWRTQWVKFFSQVAILCLFYPIILKLAIVLQILSYR